MKLRARNTSLGPISGSAANQGQFLRGVDELCVVKLLEALECIIRRRVIPEWDGGTI